MPIGSNVIIKKMNYKMIVVSGMCIVIDRFAQAWPLMTLSFNQS